MVHGAWSEYAVISVVCSMYAGYTGILLGSAGGGGTSGWLVVVWCVWYGVWCVDFEK